MLRAVGRSRQGQKLPRTTQRQMEQFLALLAKEDSVIDYRPDTILGFYRVPRRAGVDLDLIREPNK
jgi:hypothetical protein